MAQYSPRRDLIACLAVLAPVMAVFTAIWIALP